MENKLRAEYVKDSEASSPEGKQVLGKTALYLKRIGQLTYLF